MIKIACAIAVTLFVGILTIGFAFHALVADSRALSNNVAPPQPIPDQDTASENQMLAETLPLSGTMTMTCAAFESSHAVRIAGFNGDSVNRSCEARCYYHTSQNKNGMLLCSVVVPSNASALVLCEKSDQTMTYKVTNPGSFACH